MRVISSSLRKEVMGDESADVKIFLLTITHSSLAYPIRVSSHPLTRIDEDDERVYYGVVSNGITYEYGGFDCALANDESGAAPTISVTIPYASREIIENIEHMGNDIAKVTIQLVLGDNPNDVVMELKDFDMTDITYDDTQITGTISRDMLFQEPFPCHTFNNYEWRGLGWA